MSLTLQQSVLLVVTNTNMTGRYCVVASVAALIDACYTAIPEDREIPPAGVNHKSPKSFPVITHTVRSNSPIAGRCY